MISTGKNRPKLRGRDTRSEAVACVDMIRAGLMAMTNRLGIAWNEQLFLAGYSQGGHATLALQRELEQYHTKHLPLTASAPMAAPTTSPARRLPHC